MYNVSPEQFGVVFGAPELPRLRNWITDEYTIRLDDADRLLELAYFEILRSYGIPISAPHFTFMEPDRIHHQITYIRADLEHMKRARLSAIYARVVSVTSTLGSIAQIRIGYDFLLLIYDTHP